MNSSFPLAPLLTVSATAPCANRYREERLRELESRHARSCGTRSPQLYQPSRESNEEQQPRSGSGRDDEGNPDKGESFSRDSDGRRGKAQDYDNAHDSKQSRAVKAALAAAVDAASSFGEESHGLHAAENRPSSRGENSGIQGRDGPPCGFRRRSRSSGVDSIEKIKTWHGRDYNGRRNCSSPIALPTGKPLGKPPPAPSRAIPSKTLSPQHGPSGMTVGGGDGADEDSRAKKRYTWGESSDADEVQTETTSADSARQGGVPWRDEYEQDDNSVWEENMSASWEEGSAAAGGEKAPAPVVKSRVMTGTVINSGESRQGQPGGVEPRYDSSIRRPEGSSRHGRDDERDVAKADGFMRGVGPHSGVVSGGKRRQRTESESRSSPAPEPSTFLFALPVTAMGGRVPGKISPVKGGPREKTRVRGGNVGGTGNVSRWNIESGQTTASTVVEIDKSIGRGDQNNTPTSDHSRGAGGAGGARPQTDPVTRSTVAPPDSESVGHSIAGQALGKSRILTDSFRLGSERGKVWGGQTAIENASPGGEIGRGRDNGPATRGTVGNMHAGEEMREERRSLRGNELDDDDSYNSRWSLSVEDATQEQGAAPTSQASVGVERVGDVTVSMPEHQDDSFESSGRQDQEMDVSFAVSPPRCSGDKYRENAYVTLICLCDCVPVLAF